MRTRWFAARRECALKSLLWATGSAMVSYLTVTAIGVVCLALAIALDDRVGVPGLFEAWMAGPTGAAEVRYVPQPATMAAIIVIAAGLGGIVAVRACAPARAPRR